LNSSRLEAFSDGVLAIIITIMVLELKVPEGGHIETLRPLIPKFISYIISFVYVGLYWNNHHHLFHAIKKINGRILWANLFLLFSLSLLPFSSGWMGENHFGNTPVGIYGVNLIFCAITFFILELEAIKYEGKDSTIAAALKFKTKEITSTFLYIIGIVLSFFVPIASIMCYTIVALLWLIPDTRIEKILNK
jgi:uncharacterized membrane protein